MSWQVVTLRRRWRWCSSAASAWYERSRPTARLVALVAALAALAVAGRLVLAPIPNVVATTDIALITGYALGAAPGFAVGRAGGADLQPLARPGAVDRLADGGVGAGRPRRRLARRRSAGAASAGSGSRSRARLAGLAYGALLDLSVMVTYGGEQSLDRYLALSARGIPFNVAHAPGNFAIALAAGPALVRMISRFRTRLRVHLAPAPARCRCCWSRRCSAAPVGGGGSTAARGAGPSAAAWLTRAQNSDGGFGAPPGSRRARR